jgi:hypothetical protein
MGLAKGSSGEAMSKGISEKSGGDRGLVSRGLGRWAMIIACMLPIESQRGAR